MNQGVVPASAGVVSTGSNRNARALARMESETTMGLARIEQQTMLQVGRADAITYVGRSAMNDVALLSEHEAKLAQLCPMAVTRLQGIADTAALGIAEVVADTPRKVNR